MVRAWARYVDHPFVVALGNGTLPAESFKGYLVQDYLYLVRCPAAVSLEPRLGRDVDG